MLSCPANQPAHCVQKPHPGFERRGLVAYLRDWTPPSHFPAIYVSIKNHRNVRHHLPVYQVPPQLRTDGCSATENPPAQGQIQFSR